MIRGTTPTLNFTLPFDTREIEKAFVTICQNGKIAIDKSIEQCSYSGNTLTTTLTQEETLSLECGKYVSIQVRVKTKTGTALASNIITAPCDSILKEGVI